MERMSTFLQISIVLLTGVYIGATQDDVASLSAAVHKILLPIMKEIKDDLNSVKNDLNSFNKTVNNLNVKVSNLEDHQNQLSSTLNSKLDSVNASMMEELRAIESHLEEHQTQTTSELAGVNGSLQYNTQQLIQLSTDMDALDSKLDSVNGSIRERLTAMATQLGDHQTQTISELAGVNSSLQSNSQQLTQLSTDVDTLDSKLDSVNASMKEELTAMASQLGEHQTQTTSKLAGVNASLQYTTQQLTQLSTNVERLESKLDSINASMREDFRAVESQLEENQTHTSSELAGIYTSLQYSTQQLTQLSTDMDTLDLKLVSVNVSMREEFRAMESRLEEHETHTLFTLAGLHSFIQSNTFTEELIEISTRMGTLNSKLDSVNSSVTEKLRAIESHLEEHQTQTTSELAGVNGSLQSNTQQLTQLSTDVDTLDSKLDSANASIREELNKLRDHVEVHDNNTATKLVNLYQNLQQNFMELNILPLYTCGGTGGWRRVVYLNMTDPNTNCPSGWQLTGYSKRTCGKVSTGTLNCDSVTFPVSGGDYSRVCGRIKAYQVSHIDAFEAYDDGQVTTIDGAYVAGVSLTHGSPPRQHIWTFAAGSYENDYTDDDACPCDATITISVPSFVGGDYFCESGVNSGSSTGGFHPDDPLWDGQNCIATSTCCSFNSPPYFTKQLPSPTTDDIEARMCWLDSGDGSPIEFIELYVQ